jgi:hypothetical protein
VVVAAGAQQRSGVEWSGVDRPLINISTRAARAGWADVHMHVSGSVGLVLANVCRMQVILGWIRGAGFWVWMEMDGDSAMRVCGTLQNSTGLDWTEAVRGSCQNGYRSG